MSEPLYEDEVDKRRRELRAGMFAGAKASPDTEAQIQQLADRVGLPVDAVRRRQPEVEFHDRLNSFDYDKVAKENPLMAAWLAYPANAAVANDDVEQLSSLETILTRPWDLGRAIGQGAIGRGGAASLFSGAAELYDVGTRTIERGLEKVLPDVAMDFLRKPMIPSYLTPSGALRWEGEGLKRAGEAIGPGYENLATDVASGVGQLSFQIAAALMSGGTSTATSTTMMVTQGADIMAEKTANDPGAQGSVERDISIVFGSAVTALTERYGLDKILNRVPPEIKNRTLRFLADKIAAGGIEAGQEFAEGLLQDVGRVMLTNPDAKILEGIDREMTAAALSAALVRGALGVRGHRANVEQEKFFRALGDSSQNSKLRERLPDRFRELVDTYTANGPLENVMIPAERFAEYYQSVGEDPMAKAAELGIQNFGEAMVTGGDVVIPMGRFVEKIAPSDDLQGLMQDIRLRPGDDTMRENDARMRQLQEDEAKWRDELERINQAAQSETELDQAIQSVVADVEQQLLTRYDAKTSREMATVMRGVAVLAQRANPDRNPLEAAQELWGRYGLTVNTGATDGVSGEGVTLDQSAYHGSPYRFDKFTLDHIGKGEGAQAFGWGLYFAGKRAIAEYYREQLTNNAIIDIEGVGREFGLDFTASSDRVAFRQRVSAGLVAGQSPQEIAKGIRSDTMQAKDKSAWFDLVALSQMVEAYIEQSENKGQLYEVDIPSDDVLLQWDKPLSEQPEKVREAFAAILILNGRESYFSKEGGERVYMGLGSESGLLGRDAYLEASRILGSDKDASEQLNKFGVPGISYPAESLSGGKGDSRNYVIFDDGAISIMQTFYQSVSIGGSQNGSVALDTLANEGNKQAIVAQSLMDRAGLNAEQLSDVLERIALASQSDGLVDVPSLLPVLSEMGRAAFEDAKVLDAIVGSIPVDMVNDFAGGESAAKELLHDETVFKDAFAVDAQLPVTVTGDARSTVRLLVGEVARETAKTIRGALRSGLEAAEGRPAIGADDVGSFSQSDTTERRASISIAPDRTMRISLLQKANLSSFLHETGHFYLEVMGDLAQQDGTSQQVKDDWQKILTFLEVSDRSQIQVKHHEKWARAFEAYLFEGKAPAPELRGTFQRFAAWLKLIYRQLINLNVELTDEVRGVLDRIVATDAEIERAKQEADLQPLFADAAAAGMTEAEFGMYRDSIDDATSQGKEELQRKLMRIEKLKREAWWREERAKVAEKVAEEYDAQPAAQAFERMASTESQERISREQLVERFGEDVVKRLPRKRGAAVYVEGGNDIDSTAEAMGFDSADQMVQALLGLSHRAKFIAAESDRIMSETHGDLLNSIDLADAAMDAYHNESRADVIRMELRALNKELKAGFAPASALREMAKGIIGTKQVRDLNPHAYLVAERKAAREAFKQMAEGGDRREAMRLKQTELINHYMYKEALRAREEAASIAKHARSLEKDSRRKQIAKAGADYLAQIEALLERYEFRNVTNKTIERRQSLAEFVAAKTEAGEAVSIPESLIADSQVKNWRTATVDELRAMNDALRNIEHLAKLKNSITRKRKQIAFEKVKQELLDSADKAIVKDTGDADRPNMVGARAGDRAAAAWRRFDAAHLKMEQIIAWLDGGDIDGPWARYIFDLADDAQTTEYDIHERVTKVMSALAEAQTKEWRDSLTDPTRLTLRGVRGPITRYTLLSIAMNMGNAQNMQRLKDGYGWSDDDISRIKDALTLEDMRYVQGVWDTLTGELWPDIAALERRVSGLPPEQVEPQPISIKGTTFAGGYFPLVYNPRTTIAGEKQTVETESVEQFMSHGYGRASTAKGHTMQRLENFKAQPLLDFEQVLTSHIAKVAKDISHREAVISINKILLDPDIKYAIISKLGEPYYTEMRKWLQTLVNDRADSLHQATGLAKVMMQARTNTAIVTMGWKISTMMAQFAGIGPSLDLVKPRYFQKALIRLVTHPGETWQFVSGKSGEMKHRSNTIDRDIRDNLLKMRGQRGIAADVKRTAFFLTAYADRMVSVPTWLGAYEQQLAVDPNNEEAAIRAGDRAVRLSQGAGGSKDLAAVQRNNELQKLLTMYYTPFNVLYARLRDTGHQTATQGIGYLPKAAARFIKLVVLPAVLGDLLAARGPDEDEDEVWWAIRKTLLYPFASVPVVRDMAGYLEAWMIDATGEGEMRYQPSFKLSPVVGTIERVFWRTPNKVVGAFTGDVDVDDALWDVFETSGYVLGLPTAQPRISGEYLYDLLTGEAEPENAAEMMRDALFRRQKE